MIKLILLACLAVTASMTCLGQKTVTYKIKDEGQLVERNLRTKKDRKISVKRVVVIIFSENLFGDGETQREQIDGISYDEMSDKLIQNFEENELFQGCEMNLLDNQLTLKPSEKDLNEKRIDWLIQTIQKLFKITLVPEGRPIEKTYLDSVSAKMLAFFIL